MNLLVGCPLWCRGWVLPKWFAAVELAAEFARVTPSYVFVGDPRDHDSFMQVDNFLDLVDREAFLSLIEETPGTSVERSWNIERYKRMAYLRNELLRTVREANPDYFLSLDSDIILHPESIKNLFESSEQFDAVGGKTYMTPTGKQFPSYGMMPGLRRHEESSVFRVDVIMAIKLMSRDAYQVDYEVHPMGEDVGWSLACTARHVSLGWDGRVANKHIMNPKSLESFDERCGF